MIETRTIFFPRKKFPKPVGETIRYNKIAIAMAVSQLTNSPYVMLCAELISGPVEIHPIALATHAVAVQVVTVVVVAAVVRVAAAIAVVAAAADVTVVVAAPPQAVAPVLTGWPFLPIA